MQIDKYDPRSDPSIHPFIQSYKQNKQTNKQAKRQIKVEKMRCRCKKVKKSWGKKVGTVTVLYTVSSSSSSKGIEWGCATKAYKAEHKQDRKKRGWVGEWVPAGREREIER